MRKSLTHQLRGDLIGHDAIVRCGNKTHKGQVIDETKHTLTLDTPEGRVRVIKEACHVTLKGLDIQIPGRELALAPEERTRK